MREAAKASEASAKASEASAKASEAASKAIAESLAKDIFSVKMRSYGSLGNESLSAHAKSAATVVGLREPKQVGADALFSIFPDVAEAVTVPPWNQFLSWLKDWVIPDGGVTERTHVHVVLAALLAAAVAGHLQLWHEGKHEQDIPWRNIIPDFSFTDVRDACLSTIGCLFSLEAKKLRDIVSAHAQSLNYGLRTIFQRFLEAGMRGADPSKIWTIVAGSDLLEITFSLIRSGAPKPEDSYVGAEPCPIETAKLPLLGPDFEFSASSIASFVVSRWDSPTPGFRSLMRVLRGGDALRTSQEHMLLSHLSVQEAEGSITCYRLTERVGSGGTSDVYLVQGGSECCAKIPRHTSTHVIEMFDNEVEVLKDLASLHCGSIPRARLLVRAGEGRFAEAARWPVLLVSPVGMPLTRAVCELDDSGDRLELAKAVMSALAPTLQRCHAAGYIHCDLRPENIVLVLRAADASGSKLCARIERVVPVDWGLSQRHGDPFLGPGQELYAPTAILTKDRACTAGPWIDLIGAAFTGMTILFPEAACHAPWFTAPLSPLRQAWFDENCHIRCVAAASKFVTALDCGRDPVPEDYSALGRGLWVRVPATLLYLNPKIMMRLSLQEV